MSKSLEEKIYKLADLFLSVMPERHVLRWAPLEYGPTVTDDHRLYCWNEIVDVYKMFPEDEILDLYERHVVNMEDMSEDVLMELELEENLLAAIEESGGVVLQLTPKKTENRPVGPKVFYQPAEKVTEGRRPESPSIEGPDSRLVRLTRPEFLN